MYLFHFILLLFSICCFFYLEKHPSWMMSELYGHAGREGDKHGWQRVTTVIEQFPQGVGGAGPSSLFAIDRIQTLVDEETDCAQGARPPRRLLFSIWRTPKQMSPHMYVSLFIKVFLKLWIVTLLWRNDNRFCDWYNKKTVFTQQKLVLNVIWRCCDLSMSIERNCSKSESPKRFFIFRLLLLTFLFQY